MKSLGMIDSMVIHVNPNSRRGNHGDDKLANILQQLVTDLCYQRLDFPLTIIYGTLETISSCYEYFSSHLQEEQYEPVGAPKLAQYRLFTQFHAQYPERERQRIVDELVQGKSKLQIIFATDAFCIGLDIKNIRQHEVNLPADISEAEQRQLQPDVEEKLREELDLFRLSLPGSGRSSIGSTSLSSGITITLMDQVVQNAFFFKPRLKKLKAGFLYIAENMLLRFG